MASNMRIAFHDEDFLKALEKQTVNVDVAAENIVREGGEYVAKLAKSEFSGDRSIKTAGWAPSTHTGRPTRRTGALADSISTWDVERLEPGRWTSRTYGTTAYARRLELGFTGVDSLGRRYSPPNNPAKYPYLGPALRQARKGLKEIYENEWEAALRNV